MKYLVLILMSVSAHAEDWICKTQSSFKQGPTTIMTCGIGKSENVVEARDAARERAISEFRRLCSISSDCRDFDYNVEPKRLECETSQGETTCYQAIEFEILDTKRKEIYLDMTDIEKQLNIKKREVQAQEAKINKLKELKSQSELSQKNEIKLEIMEKNVDKIEGEKIKLEEQAEPDNSGYVYTHQLYKNSFKIATKYWNTDFFKTGELNAILDLTYEYRPVNWFGLGVSYGFGTDLGSTQVQSESDVSKTGTPNSSDKADGTVQIRDIGISAIFYGKKGLYLKTEAGVAQATKKVYETSYGPLGTALKTDQSTVTNSKTYIGSSIGYDSRNHQKGLGFFGEVGVRESGKLEVVGSAGMNFGF